LAPLCQEHLQASLDICSDALNEGIPNFIIADWTQNFKSQHTSTRNIINVVKSFNQKILKDDEKALDISNKTAIHIGLESHLCGRMISAGIEFNTQRLTDKELWRWEKLDGTGGNLDYGSKICLQSKLNGRYLSSQGGGIGESDDCSEGAQWTIERYNPDNESPSDPVVQAGDSICLYSVANAKYVSAPGACTDLYPPLTLESLCGNQEAFVVQAGWKDTDEDRVIDEGDNCPDTYNPEQKDIDNDGEGDACDDEYLDIFVIEPNGGETIASGSVYTVNWVAPAKAVTFALAYSRNNGKDWATIKKGILGTTYDWWVPTPTKNKNNCLIKLTGYKASGKKVAADKSDAPFTIDVMNVTSPNGGEVLASGGTFDVTWETNGTKNPVGYVKIYCSTNNGKTWDLMQTEPGNPGVSSCVFPKLKKNEKDCRVNVKAYDAADKKVAYDKSDAPFTVEVVTITSPNGGETLTSGEPYDIEWDTYETKKKVAKVVLKYTKNRGKTWKTITAIKSDNPGVWFWTVPAVTKTKNKCKVKIQLKDKNGNSLGMDTSDGYFTINP
jgi:hypothetical protein